MNLEDHDYDQYLAMKNHDFDHDAKGVIWVTIYIHIYKLSFTPAYNFYRAGLDHVLNNQDDHLLPLLLSHFLPAN